MDLPKNITQIGEADAKCKIYVEDYVVSFLKQLNPIARDKTMAAALYGKRRTEEDKTYLFVYGAGKLDFLQKETRHLSQAQRQEIERIRRQYFADFEFLGYRILDGEMVDGFFVCEQEICRYVSGYAQFYENNEAMLTYMLESRQEDAAPESVDSEKYEMVRDRQEKRRAKFTQHKKEQEQEPKRFMTQAQKRGFQTAAAAVLILLMALGTAVNGPLSEREIPLLQKIKAEFTDKKLPEAVEGKESETAEGEEEHKEVLKADDKLTEAMQAENRQEVLPVSGRVQAGSGQEASSNSSQEQAGNGQEASSNSGQEQAGNGQEASTDSSQEQAGNGQEASSNSSQVQAESGQEASTDGGQEQAGNGQETSADGGQEQAGNGQETSTDGGQEQAGNGQETSADGGQVQAGNPEGSGTGSQEAADPAKPVAYIVCQGDTLTGISIRVYGNGRHVDQICQLNQIANPDEIQVGQKILLP